MNREHCALCPWAGESVGHHLLSAHPALTHNERLHVTLTARTGPPTDSGCKEFTGGRNSKGYGVLTLDGKTYGAHRVVLGIHAVDGRTSGLYALHDCDNPPCVNPEHLRIGSAEDNTSDAASRGSFDEHPNQGEGHHNATLTEQDVLDVVCRLEAGDTHASIAEDLPVGRSMVGMIASGRAWTHVTGLRPAKDRHPRRSRTGKAPTSRRLSVDSVRDIDARLRTGSETQTAIAKEYGVTQAAISDIARGVTWSTVTGRSPS